MIFIFETFNHQGFISAEFTLLTDYTVKANAVSSKAAVCSIRGV